MTLRITSITDSFARCFEILELGLVICCCTERQGCEPWRWQKHVYQECFEFQFKCRNVRKMTSLGWLLFIKKYCKTSLLTRILCCSLILFYQPFPFHVALPPALMDRMSGGGAGWASPCLRARSRADEAHQDLLPGKEKSRSRSAWWASVDAGFVQCEKKKKKI